MIKFSFFSTILFRFISWPVSWQRLWEQQQAWQRHGLRQHLPNPARLNMLRAHIREAELAAAEVYIDRDFNVLRPDLMQALNRLSSAVYVLMLVGYVSSLGQPTDVKKLASWT